MLLWWLFCWCYTAVCVKQKSVRKKPVFNPYSLTSLEDWSVLEGSTLRASCDAAGIDNIGSAPVLASRLFHHYHGLSTSQQGKRVSLLVRVSW